MASGDTTQKKRNNYKLLVDPELKKGHKKVYRLNGKDVPGFPPVGQPKDPRTQKTVLGVTGSQIDLKMPRFKYDKHWIGDPPEWDVFVIGLNENVKGSLLKEVCTEIAPVHAIKIPRHPKTKTFLGAATVCFERPGSGRLAVSELDGKIVGGCYLRAELDDDGIHLKKYLEPVLKKCGLDKKQKHAKDGQKDPGQATSDVEESRTRNNSITESSHELSESEMESQADVATPTTPTPLPRRRKSSDSSFVAPTFYPFSSLNLLSGGSSSSHTPSTIITADSSPSVSGFSPSFTTPCTPSSIDSGISLRTNINSHPSHSPAEHTKLKPSSKTQLLPPIPAAPPPPLPPEEKAPPLPPQEQAVPPPPLSPPPPTSKEQDGIENISSDEEDENSREVEKLKIDSEKTKPDVDALSPVSLSPPSSPKAANKLDLSSLSIRNQSHSINLKPTSSQFDPSFGLQTLLASRSAAGGSTPQDGSSSPYIAVSPTPVPPTSYELEVEEISGDESPVMVYGLEVESVSEDEEDDTEQGGEDMEVCSDDENAQDNLIEVNVRPTGSAPIFQPPPAIMGGPPPQMHPQPPPNSYDIPPPRSHGFFPQRPPPPGSFPPPLHAQPLPFIPPHHHRAPHPPEMQPQGPHMMHHPPLFEFDSPLPANYPPHPPNGIVNYGSPSRFSPNFKSMSKKLKSHLPPPKDKKESISQEVLDKAMWQLQTILLNDVQKKLIETYAYSALDSFWEKREKEKLSQQSSSDQPTSEGAAEKPPKPYRSMLPGLGIDKEGEEGEEEEVVEEPSIPTPRKRLMNFKIPLINRGGQRRDQNLSIVARRRLFSEEEESPKRPSSKKPYYSSSHLSDISSSEDFSSGESEEEEGGDSAEEWGESGSSEEEPEDVSSEDEEDELRKVFGGSSESETEEEPKTELESPTDVTVAAREESKTIVKTKEAKPRVQKLSKEIKKEDKDDLKISLPGSDLESSEFKSDKESLSQTQFVKKPLPPPPPKPQFKRRSAKAEEEAVMEFVERGALDKEEVHMLKLAMARMRAEEEELLEDMIWAHFPHTPLTAPPPKRRRVEKDDHERGCARAQGYYKIDMREKKKYLPHHQVAHRMKHPTTFEPEKEKALVSSSGRVNRANQRRLASVFSSGDISSDLAKYNQLKARKKQLKFAKSTIHNWGLFAMENVAADEMVIEYVGEVVRQAVADERERRYEAAGIGSSYLFRVDHDYIIDATRNGNLARFINHCCDPNCYAKVISFGTQKKIVIYSKRDIAMGEEITYDYKFPIEDDKIPCLCGAPNCRGTLN